MRFESNLIRESGPALDDRSISLRNRLFRKRESTVAFEQRRGEGVPLPPWHLQGARTSSEFPGRRPREEKRGSFSTPPGGHCAAGKEQRGRVRELASNEPARGRSARLGGRSPLCSRTSPLRCARSPSLRTGAAAPGAWSAPASNGRGPALRGSPSGSGRAPGGFREPCRRRGRPRWAAQEHTSAQLAIPTRPRARAVGRHSPFRRTFPTGRTSSGTQRCLINGKRGKVLFR